MSSERKRKSNRANAKVSTGPKTALGKLHAVKNAYRHGLSISIFADPTRSAEVEELAVEIAGDDANFELTERARRVAEAQIDLVRIRTVRHSLLSKDFNDPEYSHQLIAVDRYERRARSRRKFAIRDFDRARLENMKSNKARL